MIPKDRIKNEIDQIPDEMAEKVLDFILHLKRAKNRKKPLRSFKLQGFFDKTDIRKKAYE